MSSSLICVDFHSSKTMTAHQQWLVDDQFDISEVCSLQWHFFDIPFIAIPCGIRDDACSKKSHPPKPKRHTFRFINFAVQASRSTLGRWETCTTVPWTPVRPKHGVFFPRKCFSVPEETLTCNANSLDCMWYYYRWTTYTFTIKCCTRGITRREETNKVKWVTSEGRCYVDLCRGGTTPDPTIHEAKRSKPSFPGIRVLYYSTYVHM